MEVPIDKPLRRGGFVKNEEGGRVWVDFRYERLPNFCYICGFLGHDEKHCQASPTEQRARRQYGDWLKAGGVIKNGGEKEKLKMQFEAKKGGMQSRVVAGENCEETGAKRRSPPTVMEADECGSAEMMDAVPLGMVEGSVTSNHRDMGGQSRWDEGVHEASGEGLVRTSREEQKIIRTEIVGNELNRNQRSQEVIEKRYGPAIKEDETLSPIGPKGKERLNKAKESGLVIKEAEALSPLRLKEKESSSGIQGKQPQSPSRLYKRVVRDKMKSMARGKGKNQNMEEFV